MSSRSVTFCTLMVFGFVFLHGQSQDPLFRLLTEQESGIDFNNQLEDTPDHNIMIYSNYYGGAGVGIGDVNNDGLPDVFFAGNLVDDRLYVNKGNLQFEDVTQKAGIHTQGWSSGVIMEDVNLDGWLDIYVTRELYDDRPDLRINSLYINQRDGTFVDEAERYGVADTARTRHATFLDYDRDGDPDLFLLNQPPNPGDYSQFYNTPLLLPQHRPRLLENRGDRFIDVSETAGFTKTGFPNSVTASDLNGDGWTDLYIANDFWVGDWYYINNGDGTFTDRIHEYARHISFSSMGVDAGDINNDGRLDIGVVDMAAEDNYRSKANMSGMNPEAFWKVVNDGDHYQYMFNNLHLNIGNGYLSDIAQLAGMATTDWSWSILMADFDHDGWKDIFITNGLMRDIRNKDAAKTFPKFLESKLHEFIQKNPNPENIGIWDIVDINEALALVPSQKLKNYAYRNNGDLTFKNVVESWGFDQETFSNGAAYADLDLDGDLDLVVNHINDVASIYENQASDRKSAHWIRIIPGQSETLHSLLGSKCWVTTGEETQYTEITSVRGMYSCSEQVAHFGIGAAETIDEIRLQWPDGAIEILTDVTVNQTLTIPYPNSPKAESNLTDEAPLLVETTSGLGLEITHTENTFDDYKSQVLLPHKMSTMGPALAVGDVNNDGLEDFYLGGSVRNPGQLCLQRADGTFSVQSDSVWLKDSRHEDVGAVFFDADQDGDLDLYVVSGGNEFLLGSTAYFDRLYENDGGGGFHRTEGSIPEISSSGAKVRPCDFDQDGDLDLLVTGRHKPWAYPEPVSSYLLRNEGGKFENITDQVATDLNEIGMINDAVWIDFDQDGWQDLAVVGEWTPLILLKNNGGEAFVKMESPIASTGWWWSIESADMDGDGDLDLVAGNLGLNYKYKATPSEPFEVFYKDFDDNQSKDIVLTYYNYGIQYPLRGRQCSSEQIPMLTEKFETYDIFASSDVGTIYGDDELKDALHYAAETFASSYFENVGNGQFVRHALPNIAQVSSVNDIILEDINQDQHVDILLAGNLYNAEVETSRNDAGFGLLLLGDGHGDFIPLDAQESGFFVPYNVKGLERIRMDGIFSILVASNHDRLRVFRVQSSSDPKVNAEIRIH